MGASHSIIKGVLSSKCWQGRRGVSKEILLVSSSRCRQYVNPIPGIGWGWWRGCECIEGVWWRRQRKESMIAHWERGTAACRTHLSLAVLQAWGEWSKQAISRIKTGVQRPSWRKQHLMAMCVQATSKGADSGNFFLSHLSRQGRRKFFAQTPVFPGLVGKSKPSQASWYLLLLLSLGFCLGKGHFCSYKGDSDPVASSSWSTHG